MCYDFILKPVWNISRSNKNFAKYYHKCTRAVMKNTRYSSRISMKLEFSRHIFHKCTNTKFNKNSPSGNRCVPWGWTDRRTDRQTGRQKGLKKLTVAFRNFSKAPKKRGLYSHDICSSRFLNIPMTDIQGHPNRRGLKTQEASWISINYGKLEILLVYDSEVKSRSSSCNVRLFTAHWNEISAAENTDTKRAFWW
jgi:hypothetical protein